MNHRGEIAYLAGIARADRGAGEQRAARAPRIHELGARRSAAENASVYDALPADGVAVVNADDAHARLLPQPRRRSGAWSTSASSAGAVSGALCARSALRARSRCARRRASARRRSPFPACTTCATRSPPRPARYAAGIAPRAHRRGARPRSGPHRPPAGEAGARRRDRDRRQLQRQSGFGARRDRRARLAARRRRCSCSATWARSASRAGSSIARSARTRARKGIDAAARARRSDARTPSRRSAPARGISTDVDELRAAGDRRGRTVLVKGSRFMQMERVVAALTGTRAKEAH